MGCCQLKSNPKPPLKREGTRTRSSVSKNAFIRLTTGTLSEKYELTKRIGDGAFGVVRLAVHKASQTNRAIKSMLITQNVDIDRMMEEVNILKNLDHPNIVKIYEVVKDNRAFNIVMEYCSGGELFDKINATQGFSENLAAKYMLDIVSAIKYCHEVNIVHRDLKPENLLFESLDPDSRLKIIDFGTSQYFRPKEKMSRFIGTCFYMAPEVIDKNYDEKCDVWSLGVILYIMLCGVPPFYSKVEVEIYEKIKKMPVVFRGEAWSTVSDEAKTLIQKMLRKDPNNRYSISDVYSDPWIQNRAHNRIPDKPIAQLALRNLSSFEAENNLQRITMSYIVTQLVTNEEINELKKMFQLIDKNGDGRLSHQEITDALNKYSISLEMNISEIMKRCDDDGNGFIDYTEFLTAAVDWQTTLSGKRLLAAFKIYDRNGDGKITLKELIETLGETGVGEDVFIDMIKKADKNCDGEIDFEEFKELMSANIKESNRV